MLNPDYEDVRLGALVENSVIYVWPKNDKTQ
jgi:hypothetical protein